MKLAPDSPMQKLLDTLPQQGKVVWIGVRAQRKEALVEVNSVEALTDRGLKGDHYTQKKGSKRQVTLIQEEHLQVVGSVMKLGKIAPGLLRRNIVISGINLLSLKDKKFKVGDVLLEYTGECHPCSRMEVNLGAGGYNAMRGHGGITARILEGGTIQLDNTVRVA